MNGRQGVEPMSQNDVCVIIIQWLSVWNGMATARDGMGVARDKGAWALVR